MHYCQAITTVDRRRETLLPLTIKSLAQAGFSKPTLYADGISSRNAVHYERFNLRVVNRFPIVKPYGNWLLAVWEMHIREPRADRYAIFQDDVLACYNLAGYLSENPFPEKGYWNLYTNPWNERDIRHSVGWHKSVMNGRGALAYIFDRPAILALLSAELTTSHPQDQFKGHRAIDYVVYEALKSKGFTEYVHYPSLVQHIGSGASTIGHTTGDDSESFRGANFDAMKFLRERDDVHT